MQKQDLISPIEQYVIDFVRILRDKKELTQTEFAKIIGVSREYVKDIENTNRRAKYNLRHINILADYFDMSPRDFLPDKPMNFDIKKPASIKNDRTFARPKKNNLKGK